MGVHKQFRAIGKTEALKYELAQFVQQSFDHVRNQVKDKYVLLVLGPNENIKVTVELDNSQIKDGVDADIIDFDDIYCRW